MGPENPPITRLLIRWSAGDQACAGELVPHIERELRRIAQRHMRRERPGHTLQTTALVNEAYLKLVDQTRADWRDRAQFFGVAAALMRRILVDHARRRGRGKRGGGEYLLPIEDALIFSPAKSAALVALDDALVDFARLYPRQARVVELRYFGGMNIEETAEVVGVHPNTVIRDWTFARAWLKRELNREGRPEKKGGGDAR